MHHFIFSLHVIGCQEALSGWPGPPYSSWFCALGTRFHGPNVPSWAVGLGTEQSMSRERSVRSGRCDGPSPAMDTSHAHLQPWALPPPKPESLCDLNIAPHPVQGRSHTPSVELSISLLGTDSLSSLPALSPLSLLIYRQNRKPRRSRHCAPGMWQVREL